MEISHWDSTFYVFTLSTARMLAAFTLIPYLSKSSVGSAMIRNGIAASLCIFLYPLVAQGYQQQTMISWLTLALLGKEVMLGLLLGFIVNIPFWAVEGVGFFIDNQRGATMASSINPLSGAEASPLGILLFQTLVTVFFISGTFLILLGVLYKSYSLWPVFEFLPTLRSAWVEFFLAQLDLIMRLILLLASPVIIGMFLTELGLALISRFAPQMNVFILAMPIKSAVAVAILTVYSALMIQYYTHYLENTPGYLQALFQLIQ